MRVIGRGAKVTIGKVKAKKDEVYVELDKQSGARHAVHLKIDKNAYTVEEVDRLFSIAFAENEADLMGAETTVNIEMGMTQEQIIEMKGKPKTRIALGSKVILTYDGLKLIFEDNKLVDVQ